MKLEQPADVGKLKEIGTMTSTLDSDSALAPAAFSQQFLAMFTSASV